MKIVIISHTYISPINRDKWKSLAKKYTDTQLFIIIPKQWPTFFFTTKADDVTQENLPNCHFIPLKTYQSGNEIRYFYAPISFIKTIKKIKPDLIHVEQGAGALSYFQAIVSAKLANIKTTFCFFTWINWQSRSYGKLNKLWRYIEQFNINHSNGAIVGNHDAQIILTKKGIKKPTLVLPQLGVNQLIFKPAKQDPASPSIVYIGRLVEEKGVMLLLKAFINVHEKFPEWKLIFIGSGPVEKKLIDTVITEKILHKVEFKPPVSHEKIATFLQQMSLLVLPSYDTKLWREQFGHVLIEAMSCKIPVLGSSAGEIPHVIQEAGTIFEQGNQEDLERKLIPLMQSNTLRKALGEKGYQHVLHHYTHEVISDKTYAFWQKIIIQHSTQTHD